MSIRAICGAAALAASVPAALLAMATPALAATAATTTAVPVYSLSSTLSPAAMTAAACKSDKTCVAAPAPAGGTTDDYAALQQAITTAAGKAGTGQATVLLAAGTYRLTNGLSLPPNVNLRGAGITATTLLMDPTVNWKNFSYNFLIRPSGAKVAGSSNLVSDLTVNGNCRTGAGSATAAALPGRAGQICDFRTSTGATGTTGGGISVGDRWTVRQVRFTNFEYFKLWVSGTVGVDITDNRFDNWGGAESDGEDNIGGGGRNDGTIIENNQYDATANGNFFDFTNAIRTVVRNNIVHTTPAVAAARGVTEYGNVFLEGVVGATVSGNTLQGAHIVLSSNANYAHSGANKDVTEPLNDTVTGNKIYDSATVGIAVSYSDYADADGTAGTAGGWNDTSTDPADHLVRLGGGNVIQNNVIERPRQSGIIVYGTGQVKNTADTVTGNRILDAGYGGSSAYNTGAGYFDTAGIGLGLGSGDAVYGNTIVDDQPTPTTWYGIQLGVRKGTSSPTGTVLTGPGGSANTTSGVISAVLRTAASAPETPGNLTATASTTTLTWDESSATSNAVAGYRVYRNGTLQATLPVGSTAIPRNLLDADSSSLESASAGTASWTAATGTKLSRSTSAGAVGQSSLMLTATTAGQLSATGKKVVATAGTTYTAVGSFEAATIGRTVRAGLVFTDAAGKVTKVAAQNMATVDAASGWVTASYSAVAPAGTVSVQSVVLIDGASAGESHLVDRLGLVTGTSTEQWTAASSAGRYQVVAYRAGSGDLSAVSAVSF